jgi:hypothetical protein
MTRDEQARARLVEIALECAMASDAGDVCPLCDASTTRRRAGLRDPSKGSWSAAGLTAAMEDAGLVVPAPGTEARRRAIALLDFVTLSNPWPGVPRGYRLGDPDKAQPGDVIAWLQHPPPDPMDWRLVVASGESHLFRGRDSTLSACGAVSFADVRKPVISGRVNRCESCARTMRRGHVAVIVAADDESITTVGWGEGPKPGRVMMRQLWRDPERRCGACFGEGRVPVARRGAVGQMEPGPTAMCAECNGVGRVPRSSTVLRRRPGGLYGIARPVAR